MIQTIKSEYGFDLEGRNLKISSKMAVSYVPKTYLTKNLDIKHFNFDFLWMFRGLK